MPFDSVEAWDVMNDEIIEFQDSPHFLPTDAADFTFIEIDDYKVRNYLVYYTSKFFIMSTEFDKNISGMIALITKMDFIFS